MKARRTPAPFNVAQSVKHTLLQPKRMEITEQVFERYIGEVAGARVSCVVRHTSEELLVQYFTLEDRNKAIENCEIAAPGLIFICQAKQRFLEQNVEMEIMMSIQKNPQFMKMIPSANVLQALFNGSIPLVDQSFETVVKLPPYKKLKIEGRRALKTRHNKRIGSQAMNLFGVFYKFLHSVSEEVEDARQERKLAKKQAKLLKRQKKNKRSSGISH